MRRTWFLRRWTDIRNGLDHYIAKVVAFASFVLVIRLNYPDLFVDTPIIFAGLVALAGGLGYLHRIVQWGTDNNSALENAPLQAWVYKTILKAVSGRATKEEIDSTIAFLDKIQSGQK